MIGEDITQALYRRGEGVPGREGLDPLTHAAERRIIEIVATGDHVDTVADGLPLSLLCVTDEHPGLSRIGDDRIERIVWSGCRVVLQSPTSRGQVGFGEHVTGEQSPGAQSLAVVMRGLVMREIPKERPVVHILGKFPLAQQRL